MPPTLPGRHLRPWILLLAVVSLAGCASRVSQIAETQEAQQYAAHARQDYTPPGPPEDPWGPYIVEAAQRYDVPEQWIRGVMRQESGGRLYENGQLITSPTGAMGLMQVEPTTYDELRGRYGFGDDPYDPHENILAGTAYIRELYDAYGSPAFLAAYNAGPGRLDEYLANRGGLPAETRHYVAAIAPGIMGYEPNHRSDAQMLAMNQIPIDIPAGPRFPRHPVREPAVALARNERYRRGLARHAPVEVATLVQPPRYAATPHAQLASLQVPHGSRGFHLISRAMADTVPLRSGGPTTGNWAIQVGAFGNANQAHSAASAARGGLLASAHPTIGTVRQGHNTLYRARLTGLSRDAAVQACVHMGRAHCIVLSPDAQS